MSDRAVIYLPWPDRKLSPNSRLHWAAVAKAKKKARQDAYYLALEAGLHSIGADSVNARYSFYPPSRRTYDKDNLIASMKAAQDGIAQAIGIDDGKWETHHDLKGTIEKNGMVKIELEWSAS